MSHLHRLAFGDMQEGGSNCILEHYFSRFIFYFLFYIPIKVSPPSYLPRIPLVFPAPHLLLLDFSSEKDRPPIDINQTWAIKLQ